MNWKTNYFGNDRMRRQVYFESDTWAIGELAQAQEITQDIRMVTEDLKLPDNTIRRLLCTQFMDRFHVHTRRLLTGERSQIRAILARRWRIWAQINTERHIHGLAPVPAPKQMSGYRGRYGFTREGVPTSDNLLTLDEARRSLSATVPDTFPEPAVASQPAAAQPPSSISSFPGDPDNHIAIDEDEDGDIEIIQLPRGPRPRHRRRRRRQRRRSPRPHNFSTSGQSPEAVPDNNSQNANQHTDSQHQTDQKTEQKEEQ